MRIEVVVDVKTTLGESPVWDADAERIYWVDSLGRRVFRATADGREVRAWTTPASCGSMVLRRRGGAVLALRSGVHFLDFATGDLEWLVDPEPDLPDNTLNDGKVDRAGRFWFGSMNTAGPEPTGALYRLDPDLTLRVVDRGIACSNGPCWSPDGGTFYFGDSGTREIHAYDFAAAEGRLSGRRLFCRAEERATVDGATVDAEGCLWSAQPDGGTIRRYSPEGELIRTIELPSLAVTSVTFGGPALDVLFVTSMASPLDPAVTDRNPQRGSLFAIHDLGVRGVEEPKFAG
ncbi:Sugar lactone lactonase YvrE [Faunimonas pinastri]|uniref:Sugar lactone lactonase YvrE n=1 Tax=Faunimonas pinastri TaxID=1855383 RepID=A0A1H9B3Y3_9HYPH|nr:SMP-30/gluconolactonase/LRE family protein [Faunimonas pinastri]SEP82948.1 Sugar lactone lactonase YvrE [Faunimonas pinastri]